ncbi:hypothetical protein NDU88_006835 [Pleurodeles waltl]|uniref:Uncharacterized protein n=1 Tax=Pleurodeles waltl TaxID=8319 RepID=A0AAV7MEL0_PLEWA|nr:hypothetical protein NDU88_006835 [Pleurodeles waltl]
MAENAARNIVLAYQRKVYEEEDRAGRLLASLGSREQESSWVHDLRTEKVEVVRGNGKSANEFAHCCSSLYSKHTKQSHTAMREFLGYSRHSQGKCSIRVAYCQSRTGNR